MPGSFSQNVQSQAEIEPKTTGSSFIQKLRGFFPSLYQDSKVTAQDNESKACTDEKSAYDRDIHLLEMNDQSAHHNRNRLVNLHLRAALDKAPLIGLHSQMSISRGIQELDRLVDGIVVYVEGDLPAHPLVCLRARDLRQGVSETLRCKSRLPIRQ